jgi:hypothetical protein
VYYNVPSITTETSWAQYCAGGGYYINYNSVKWSITGPNIPGSLATDQVTSLAITENTSTIDPTSNTLYVGTAGGLAVIQEIQGHANLADGSVESSGSLKFYTKDYISEEMVGDIRGMWPLNNANSSSDFEDVSIKANNLTGTNITAGGDSVSGVRGTATDFDGSTEYLSRASDTDFNVSTTMTFGAWIKTSSATRQAIISRYGQDSGSSLTNAFYDVEVQANGTARTTWRDDTDGSTDALDSVQTVRDGQWHHILAQRDGSTLRLFIDGQKVGEKTTAETGTYTFDDTLTIGVIGINQFAPFNGSIDEAFVTATTLTPAQIKNMYQVGARALKSHGTTLGGGSADANQQLGYISTGTNTVGIVQPDWNNQYMYVGLNSTTLGGLSKIQLNSDTNIKTYNSSANVPTGGTLLIDEDVTSLGVGYQLEAVGSAASGVKSMAPDNNSNNLTGSLFSETQTLNSSTKFAYLWTSFVADSNDASNGINIYACNAYSTKALCDSNNAWVLGTIIMTDSNQTPPEKEYSFSFPTAGANLTFKFDFARGSTKTNTYIARYGTTWASSVGGADIAERYKSVEPTFPGDILSIAAPPVKGEASVALSRIPYDQTLIGVVTTNPGIVMDNNLVDLNFNAASRNSPNRPAVALAGRVPVKVSTVNGAIQPGDYITSSEIPGVGIKAIKAGATIGKALEGFECPPAEILPVPDASASGEFATESAQIAADSDQVATSSAELTKKACEGKVMILVNVSWYDPDVYIKSIGNLQFSKEVADAQHTIYRIVKVAVDGTNEVVDRVGIFGELVAGNIKAGAVESRNFITDNLVAKVIKTNVISPLPDQTDITFQVGSEATPSGKLAIRNAQGTEVASIDSSGSAKFAEVHTDSLMAESATISGTLEADNIKSKSLDEIQELLAQVQEDQELLSESANWNINTATDSAVLDQLAISDLYVTNQAAFNSLSLSQSLTLGPDMVFSSSIDNQLSTISNSLDTLTYPLKIQSLAMAPVEIMAGLITIDTQGNVNIAGNLNVAGRIESSGLTLKDNPDLTGGTPVSGAERLLSLRDSEGNEVSAINASGSAIFRGLTIAGGEVTTSSTSLEGLVTETNSTIGKAIIPEGEREITIKSPKITDYSLVYVTPTSDTQNYVLYIKEKGQGYFKVGFDRELDSDVSFNWWIVEVQN